MNTTSFKLTALAISCLAGIELRAQPSTGMYSSTVWASTNLLINTALEAGVQGQVLGYNANLQIIPLTQSGADTNAVASVLDTNALSSLSGYTKSWVGPTHTMSGHALWSLQPWSEQADLIDNGLWYASTGTFVVNPDGSGSCTDSDGNLGGTFAVVTDIQNAIYYIAFQGKADNTDCILRNSSNWTNPQWEGETNLLTSYRWYFCSYTAAVTNALSITAFAPLAARTFTIRDFYWSNQPFFDEIRNAVVSPTEGMAWKRTGDIYPDAISDGQTYGRKDGAWAVAAGGSGGTANIFDLVVNATSYSTPIPANSGTVIIDHRVNGAGSPLSMNGQPTVSAGEYNGQRITFVSHTANQADIIFNDRTYVPGSDLNLFGITTVLLVPNNAGASVMELIWNGSEWTQFTGPGTPAIVEIDNP